MVEQEYVEGPDWHGSPTKMRVGSHCNILQYRLLKRCSERKNTKLWNWYRKRYPEYEIVLQGVNLQDAHLQHANLQFAHLQFANLRDAHLEVAKLNYTHLEHADLLEAHLEHASLYRVHLEHATPRGARLEYANLYEAHLEHAKLREAHFEHANMENAHLEHANLYKTHLQEAYLLYAHLDGANLTLADITGTCFFCASLSNATISQIKHFDTRTDFSITNLNEARMCPKLQSQLEYNIRRKNWSFWCSGKDVAGQFNTIWRKQITGRLVSCFWWASDYGTNSMRLILFFLFLSIFFGGIYWLCPECVVGLDKTYVDGLSVNVSPQILPLRAFYFSVVTMTTLGFGDIHATPDRISGHVLLTIQVLLGYILLGAFITRFGILFMSKAPCPKVLRAKEDDILWKLKRWDINHTPWIKDKIEDSSDL